MEEMKGNRSVREVDKEYDFVFIFRGRARRRAWQWASASVAAGSEGGTRASGDARRLRKIRSSPPSFAARSNISHPLGFDRASIRGDDSRRAMLLLVQGNTCATIDTVGKKEKKQRESPFILFHGLERAWKSFAGSSPFGWMFRCSVGGETCANRFVIVSMMFS